jgi:DNA-binding HxlR family transcriptional regulator
MTTRAYGQFCPVARALDVVGERWTLLIVRDLILGPRRFTDLQTSLTGLGTSLLAQRLKQLETVGVIRRRQLPPPAPSTVYELTGSGWRLAPAVRILADWGSQFLHTPEPTETIRPEYLAMPRAAAVPAAALAHMDYTIELRVGDRLAHLRVVGRAATTHSGPAPQAPDLVLTADAAAFADLALGRLSVDSLLASERIQVEGVPGALAAVRAVFSNPPHSRPEGTVRT